jgi:uncharacterized protein
MLYRRFGRTNLQMPVFSCGGMRFQHQWKDLPLAQVPAEKQANLEATVRRALELGMNHIETARGYGSSERQLGVILPKLPREKMIVQTKVSPTKRPGEFAAHVEESLWRMRVGHLDLLGIHGVNDEEQLEYAIGKRGSGGCLAAARELQKRGLVRHVGFSSHGAPGVILEAVRHEGDGGFDYVNLHWYWIYQRNWGAIEEATRRDMGVFIISPSDKGGKLYEPPEKLVRMCEPWHPLVFNCVFCLSRPEVHTLSLGPARPSDLELAQGALAHLEGSGLATLRVIEERLKKAYEEAVPAELRDPFGLKLPEWREAPGQMNIMVMLWLRNLVKAFDMKGYGEMRYNLLGNGGHWFPGLNAGKVEGLDLREVARGAGMEEETLRGMLKETHEMLWKAPVKRLSQT